jgi:hypothetical protein
MSNVRKRQKMSEHASEAKLVMAKSACAGRLRSWLTDLTTTAELGSLT